jgi:NADH-quinone oxidoreductase subunit A
VGVLALGLAYAWGKGYLDWEKPQPKIPEIDSPVPPELYQQVNERYSR